MTDVIALAPTLWIEDLLAITQSTLAPWIAY